MHSKKQRIGVEKGKRENHEKGKRKNHKIIWTGNAKMVAVSVQGEPELA